MFTDRSENLATSNQASGAVSVLAVGECMVEVRQTSPAQATVGYAGDTYNTAVYARRTFDSLGVRADVGYLTGLGADHLSAAMRAAWAQERVSDRSLIVPDHVPGLYSVNTDATGERSFAYWRSESAARTLLSQPGVWIERVVGDVIHFSGISLSLMSTDSRQMFLLRVADLQSRGSLVSFDTNYRPSMWPDADDARSAMDLAAAVSDIVLVTDDDEIALRDFAREDKDLTEEITTHYHRLGAKEVVVKQGPKGALVSFAQSQTFVPAAAVERVRDTTAAGDSFAGAYLAARVAGLDPHGAAKCGVSLAAQVVQSRGAIVPTTGPWAAANHHHHVDTFDILPPQK